MALPMQRPNRFGRSAMMDRPMGPGGPVATTPMRPQVMPQVMPQATPQVMPQQTQAVPQQPQVMPQVMPQQTQAMSQQQPQVMPQVMPQEVSPEMALQLRNQYMQYMQSLGAPMQIQTPLGIGGTGLVPLNPMQGIGGTGLVPLNPMQGPGGTVAPPTFTPEQYGLAGQFMNANMNNPALIAATAQQYGMNTNDLLTAAQTVNPNITRDQVSQYLQPPIQTQLPGGTGQPLTGQAISSAVRPSFQPLQPQTQAQLPSGIGQSLQGFNQLQGMNQASPPTPAQTPMQPSTQNQAQPQQAPGMMQQGIGSLAQANPSTPAQGSSGVM